MTYKKKIDGELVELPYEQNVNKSTAVTITLNNDKPTVIITIDLVAASVDNSGTKKFIDTSGEVLVPRWMKTDDE